MTHENVYRYTYIYFIDAYAYEIHIFVSHTKYVSDCQCFCCLNHKKDAKSDLSSSCIIDAWFYSPLSVP